MTSNESPGRARSLSDPSVATLTALDLYTIVATGMLLWLEGLPTVVRISLALPILVFIPGYALLSALVPSAHASNVDTRTGGDGRDREGLRPVERGVLAVVASVALVPFVALVVAYVASVALTAVLAAVAGITLFTSVVAIVRTYTGARSSLSPNRTRAGDDSPLPTAAAVLALVVTAVTLAVVLVMRVSV